MIVCTSGIGQAMARARWILSYHLISAVSGVALWLPLRLKAVSAFQWIVKKSVKTRNSLFATDPSDQSVTGDALNTYLHAKIALGGFAIKLIHSSPPDRTATFKQGCTITYS